MVPQWSVFRLDSTCSSSFVFLLLLLLLLVSGSSYSTRCDFLWFSPIFVFLRNKKSHFWVSGKKKLIGKNGWRKIKNKKPKTTSRWASKQSRSGSITHTHSSTHISGVERECDGLFAVRLISSLRFTLFNERGKPAKPTYIVDSTRYMLYTYI
jgi:hypothetical protein